MSLRLIFSFLLVLMIVAPPDAQAQEDVEVPEDGAWNTSLSGKLSGSQAAYSNWQEGGLNTLSLTSSVDGKFVRGGDHWIQTYELRLAFGLVQQDTLAVRKSDDLIRLRAGLQYQGDGFLRTFRPTISAALRTQFAEGFNYDEDPFSDDVERTLPVKTSEFFSPAVLTQSLGLTYEPAPWVATRLGVAGKETVVRNETLRVLYDVDPESVVRAEGGIESETSVDREIVTNVRYQSSLNLFQSLTAGSEPLDVLWENVITMRVNSWLNVGLEYVMLYDANRSQDVQIKEVLSVGISFDLL
jgi:hypothetical protein